MKIYTSIETFGNVNNPVLTTGTFDGVHIGHQKIISQLNQIANEVGGESVLLTFSPHPRMVLFPDDENIRLLNTQEEKIHQLEKIGLQNLIMFPFTKEFSRLTYIEYVRDLLVNRIGVKQLVIGYDHQFGRNREGSFEQLVELSTVYDYEVREISAQTIDDTNISSTKIRKALEMGDVESANLFLGYQYELTGIVIKGDQLGRTIGYPTANIHVEDKTKLIPSNGVYAVKVKWQNKWYDGMLNIGVRPTLNGESDRRVEVHVLGIDADFYDNLITVRFVTRIRDEMKFGSTEELKEQIGKDQIRILNILEK